MRGAMAAPVPEEPRHPLPVQGGDRPKGRNALGTLAHYPRLARAFHTFNGHILFGSSLSLRQRELIVLRVASRRACDYEWKQHVVQGVDVGLSLEEVYRVIDGTAASGWSPLEQQILQAVDELVADALVTDETWAGLADVLDTEQLMDLLFTVGCYDMIAMLFNSAGVQSDADLLSFLEANDLQR
jgi:alkylhydroperoxidase family enzyme